MSDLELRPLKRAHAARMQEINRACPIEADFTFFFDREPDFFRWPDSVFDVYVYLGGFRGETLVAYGMFANVAGHTGSPSNRYGYVGDFRVLPAERGNAFPAKAAQSLLEMVAPQAVTLGLVKRGNEAALAALTKAGAIHVQKLCGFDAAGILLLRRTGGRRRFRVRRANEGDAQNLAALMQRAYDRRLFAPIVDRDELLLDARELPGFGLESYWLAFAGSELVGALGAWDGDSLRRATVLRLSKRAKVLRAAYQAARFVYQSAAPMPVPGESFRTLTATRVAVPSDDHEVLHDLLATVQDECLGRFHMLVVGFAGDDPLAPSLRGMLAHHFLSDVFIMGTSTNVESAMRGGRPYLDLRFV